MHIMYLSYFMSFSYIRTRCLSIYQTTTHIYIFIFERFLSLYLHGTNIQSVCLIIKIMYLDHHDNVT